MRDTDFELIVAFAECHPAGVARVLEQNPEATGAALLARMPAAAAAATLQEMVPIQAARLLERAAAKNAAAIIEELPLASAAALLRRTSDEVRKSTLGALGESARRRSLGELLSHEPGTAGALMDPMVLALPDALDAEAALAVVRKHPERAMYYLYVTGDGGRLVGVVNQRELMLAPSSAALTAIMTAQPESLLTNAGREAIASHPAWQRVHALPVVDKNGLFLGAIRYESVRRIERDLGKRAHASDAQETSAALAELYGLGLGGIVEWATSAVRGPAPRRRARSAR